MNALVPLPVVLPLLGAGLTLVFGHSARAQRFVSMAVLGSVVVVAGILLVAAHTDGPQVMELGGWSAPVGIVLIADRLSALMLLVSVTVSLCVLVFSLGQGVVEFGRDTPLSVYHPTFLVLVAGVANAFLSGDLFNIYVGFEILLAASYVLLTLGGTGSRIRAGTTYVIVSLVSSIVFLVAIAAIYAATGTVNLAHLTVRLAQLPDGVALVLQLLLLSAFAIKAAVFPLSAWLPDSYPTAPAPVTAVFAGLLTKVGVYAIIRTQTLLFPEGRVDTVLMWAALFTMVIGILGAVAQSDIKRMLSFTLVSHIGFMVFGISLGTVQGLSGAVFYVVHHITIQTTLFLVAGLIERRGGSTSLDRLGGLARLSPVLAILFFVPAINLAGIPPFSGFLGKMGLLQAGVAEGHWLAYALVTGGVVTSLLTLYAMAKAWNRAFWQSAPEPLVTPPPSPPEGDGRMAAPVGALHGSPAPRGPAPRGASGAVGTGPADRRDPHLPRLMVLPTAALVLIGMALSVVAGPLYGITDSAAGDMYSRAPYVDAVLPEGAP